MCPNMPFLSYVDYWKYTHNVSLKNKAFTQTQDGCHPMRVLGNERNASVCCSTNISSGGSIAPRDQSTFMSQVTYLFTVLKVLSTNSNGFPFTGSVRIIIIIILKKRTGLLDFLN